MPKIAKRHQYADYLNIGTTASKNWVLMGTGFTKIDEEPGAQTETSKYVNEVTSSTEIVSYETSFPFDADQVLTEDAIDALYQVGRNHYVGEDAEFEYCRVELWNPVSDESTTLFEARLFTVAAEISSISGDNKQVVSGTLHAIGDPTEGTFDTSSNTFESASEAETTAE